MADPVEKLVEIKIHGVTYIAHECDRKTYKYVDIFKDGQQWMIDIDSQSNCIIKFCPFCGKKLP